MRILIVDDEALIRWWLTEALSDRGHLTTEAGDGQTALRLLGSNGEKPDFVLLDYRLPDSEDLELLSNIVRNAPTVRVVLMTAYSEPGVAQAARARGAYAVLQKPFALDDVLAVIEPTAASPESR